MKAKTKGIIGAAVGVAVIIFGLVYGSRMSNEPLQVSMLLLAIPVGAIEGFGYVFGLAKCKGWLSKWLGVAATASLWTILFSRNTNDGIFKSILIFMFTITFILGFCFIPGIFTGVKQIKAENY